MNPSSEHAEHSLPALGAGVPPNSSRDELPPLAHVLWAPWGYALQPERAATVFIRARGRQVVLAVAVAFFLLVVAVLAAKWWLDAPRHPDQKLWATQAVPLPDDPFFTAVIRTFPIVWSNWHRQGWWGPFEQVLLTAIVGPLVLLLIAAWIQLPLIHRCGPLRVSFGRALRAVAAGCGALALGAALAAVPVLSRMAGSRRFCEDTALMLGTSAALWLAAWWAGRAARSVARNARPAGQPSCPHCGCRLDTQSAAGRCGECGLPLVPAFGAGTCGSGRPRWRGPAPWAWPAVMLNVLVRPRRFYAALKSRENGSFQRRFAVWTVVTLAAALAALHVAEYNAMQLGWSIQLGGPWRLHLSLGLFIEAAARAALLAWLCWVGHGAVCAVVTACWASRGALGDYHLLARALGYEVACLWVVGGFWGLASSGWLLYCQCRTWQTGRPWGYVMGVWPEILLLYGGLAVLMLAWLWRLRIIRRAACEADF
jgi:hypothetical protein